MKWKATDIEKWWTGLPQVSSWKPEQCCKEHKHPPTPSCLGQPPFYRWWQWGTKGIYSWPKTYSFESAKSHVKCRTCQQLPSIHHCKATLHGSTPCTFETLSIHIHELTSFSKKSPLLPGYSWMFIYKFTLHCYGLSTAKWFTKLMLMHFPIFYFLISSSHHIGEHIYVDTWKFTTWNLFASTPRYYFPAFVVTASHPVNSPNSEEPLSSRHVTYQSLELHLVPFPNEINVARSTWGLRSQVLTTTTVLSKSKTL